MKVDSEVVVTSREISISSSRETTIEAIVAIPDEASSKTVGSKASTSISSKVIAIRGKIAKAISRKANGAMIRKTSSEDSRSFDQLIAASLINHPLIRCNKIGLSVEEKGKLQTLQQNFRKKALTMRLRDISAALTTSPSFSD
jgi:hypothetical protein